MDALPLARWTFTRTFHFFFSATAARRHIAPPLILCATCRAHSVARLDDSAPFGARTMHVCPDCCHRRHLPLRPCLCIIDAVLSAVLSWNDGESSSTSVLGVTSVSFFLGLAVGCPKVCRIHGLEPVKWVAFNGTNIGRQFYMCLVQIVSQFEPRMMLLVDSYWLLS
jgi:hypothetical protein